MLAAALAWGESILQSPLMQVEELTGGLTSTMLALHYASGQRRVLRLMDKEPWQAHGSALTTREQAAMYVLATTAVPAPQSIALDADGAAAGVPAHLMTHLPGVPTQKADNNTVTAMAEMLATIHAVKPEVSFRAYQSWAWDAKWVVPLWTGHPESWRRAFDILAEEPPPFTPTFLHRDFSHRNLLWRAGEISAVVDWVETSSGPAWLDAAHAATNLALEFGPGPARAFLTRYAELATDEPAVHWLLMDAVGFLPPPDKPRMFGSPKQLLSLDEWLHELVSCASP